MSDAAFGEMRPIGVIRSPFKGLKGMPIQPAGADGVVGTIEVYPEFVEGLLDLDGFSHIILLYAFSESKGYDAVVTPFMDAAPHGVFATRAPRRPNPIGLSVVRLMSMDEGVLHIENVDVLDGTPLLDIKPHVPKFIPDGPVRVGWLAPAHDSVVQRRSDDRFL
ncbi:MAG: tRNA (N6-threonylcarbamoyladenosine(37)-N6)-methyltransferase TrmO [Coriobacteriia bacterium]|nr:tRNA (N6-threonylcarbamoyladenosine(37)-N6)-methyltransferase TrmO [Coriobacteriia bacterium]